MRGVVVLDMGQGEVEGTRVRVRREVKVGFHVNSGVWEDISRSGEGWG